MDVKVQSFESFKGPFYHEQAPKEIVLLIVRVKDSKERIQLLGVNAKQGHVGFVLEANAADKQAIIARLQGELAEKGGVIGVTWDISLVAQGVVGPGPAPGPGPVGVPDAVLFARNVLALSQLDANGQRWLNGVLGERGGAAGQVG
jgi:hypothetical protein